MLYCLPTEDLISTKCTLDTIPNTLTTTNVKYTIRNSLLTII